MSDDAEHLQTEILPPRAGSLIESMRDIGYSLETAVADLVDNSVTAGASRVDIRYGWTDTGHPWISVTDDGHGMTEAGLVEAMRPGSRSPRDKRDPGDLGRFGLGLKTASFSQCRRVTVISKRAGITSGRCWDLDLVEERNDWVLVKVQADIIHRLPGVDPLPAMGTCVLWEQIDRLDLGNDSVTAHDRFNDRIASIREHLALVFHRFLKDDRGRRVVRIFINNLEIEAHDPFHSTGSESTQLPEESFSVEGERVVMQPFILPHHSMTSAADYERLAGREGYLRTQGFYIYRNRRLIIHGTWFRMARQEQLTKLARVRVDIPNTLDHLWTIDVKKSRAHPPEAITRRMGQLVSTIKEASKRPYIHRGRVIREKVTSPVWQRVVFNERVEYQVNQEHPLLSEFRADLDQSTKDRFDLLLRMVGSSFPGPLLYNDMAENPKQTGPLPDDDLLGRLASLFLGLNPGATRTEMESKMRSTVPFASDPGFILRFLNQHFPQ